jgi:MFS transporter, DHA1 family, multidrug resistance protein
VTTTVYPGDSLTPRQRLVYVVVLGALTALGPFTIDLYLPAFPAVEAAFNSTEAAVQLTLTATTIGFALGQLVVGPWSDKSGGVVAMAMVRDLFGGLPLVRMLSRLALVSGLAPIIAPVIGSQLLLVLDWRGIFWFLTAYGIIVILAAIFFLVETLPKERREDKGHSTVGERYKALFSDRVFVGVAIVAGMTFSGLFAYLSASSFLFQDGFGFNAQQFGFLFAINSLGVVFGVQTSSRLAKYFGPQWILLGAVIGMLVSATTIVALDLAGAGLTGIVIPLWFFIASCGFAFPCQQVLALANHGGEAATAASLMGAINFGLAGAISPIVGLLGVSAHTMGMVMGVTSIVSLLVFATLIRPRTVPALSR